MKFRSTYRLFPALALVLSLPALVQAAVPALDTYVLDNVHSSVGFSVKHLFGRVPGRFTKFSGTIKLDPANLANSSVDVAIDPASINTGTSPSDFDKDGKAKAMSPAARDNHLRSDAFFDVAKYPAITFKSVSVAEPVKGQLAVTGLFTMHGVTKTIVLPVTDWAVGPGPKPGTFMAGGDVELTLKRSDYNMGYGIAMGVGDEVKITLNVEADKQ